MRKATEQDVRAFAERCDEIRRAYYDRNFPGQFKPITVSMGKKYAKLICDGAWAFIDLATGDVLKAATWAAPAKHARGNIFDEFEGMKHIGPYGPAYLK